MDEPLRLVKDTGNVFTVHGRHLDVHQHDVERFVATIEIDGRVDSDWLEDLPFVSSNQPDGARALLATVGVAGSMITVTGITFSLTLLAVSHATSQFGPRLLTNFMRDRGNQLTLGTFVATFLYCLMVLRTVRSAEEARGFGDHSKDLTGAFVPHVRLYGDSTDHRQRRRPDLFHSPYT